MRTTNFTPGPWRVEEHRGMICVAADKHKTLCAVGYDSAAEHPDDVREGLRPDNKANARLIAAAPELLEALEALASTARTFRNVPKEEQEWTSLDDAALDAAFAAIAKATTTKGGDDK